MKKLQQAPALDFSTAITIPPFRRTKQRMKIRPRRWTFSPLSPFRHYSDRETCDTEPMNGAENVFSTKQHVATLF
jgi:hypothetical protein